MQPAHRIWRRRCQSLLAAGVLSTLIITLTGPVSQAGGLLSKIFYSPIERIGSDIDCLERQLHQHGTVVAKAPDIWGEARLTAHREEFEKVLAGQIDKFELRLNAATRRSDQAFLANALAIQAAFGNKPGSDAVPVPTATATPNATTSGDLTLVNQMIGPSPTAGTGTPASVEGAAITRTSPGALANNVSGIPFGGFANSNNVGLEPTIVLDQLARYVNHLNEIRRVNEGDDTTDSPGYSLNLVRIPVSVLPGTKTREGHGAEITITATPNVTEELLPTVFRALVINDLVDQLSPSLTKILNDPTYNEIQKATPKAEATDSESPRPRGLLQRLQQSSMPEAVDQERAKTNTKVYRQQLETMTKRVTFGGFSSRRSRLPVTSTQRLSVFGESELDQIVNDAHQAFDDYVTSNKVIHLTEMRNYLKEELEAAYDYLSEPGFDRWTPLYLPVGAQSLAQEIRGMRAPAVRAAFFQSLHSIHDADAEKAKNTTEALAWAISVESALLNQQLNSDLKTVSQNPECHCVPVLPTGAEFVFYGSNPLPEARMAFAEYVKCRWPIHVFALDPVTQDQNVADVFSLRRETQLSLALAFASGRINAQNMTRYVRRIEMDMETVALNRTAVAFGHGSDTFGWRFEPRVQTPPIESNLTVVGRDLLWGGPDRDQGIARRKIEPGMRECVALVVMPSFVPNLTFDIRSNWYRLTPEMCGNWHYLKSPCQLKTSVTETLRMSETIKCIQDSVQCCFEDAQRFRPGELQRLVKRVEQLEKRLPLQTVHAQVPYENTLGGFEMFSSGITDLTPELLDFYGEPGIDPSRETKLFLVGDNFSVRGTKVIAGNRPVEFSLLSRQVMKVTIPAGVQSVNPKSMTKKSQSEASDPTESSDSYVDVQLATPYGVTNHLRIPVIQSPGSSIAKMALEPHNLVATYYYKSNEKGEQSLDAIRPHDGRTMVVKAAAAPPVPRKVTLQVTLETSDAEILQDVNLPTSSPSFPIADLDYDPDFGGYVIRNQKFAEFHRETAKRVLEYLNGRNPKTSLFPSKPMEIVVRLQVSAVDANIGSLVLDKPCTLTIRFAKRP